MLQWYIRSLSRTFVPRHTRNFFWAVPISLALLVPLLKSVCGLSVHVNIPFSPAIIMIVTIANQNPPQNTTFSQSILCSLIACKVLFEFLMTRGAKRFKPAAQVYTFAACAALFARFHAF